MVPEKRQVLFDIEGYRAFDLAACDIPTIQAFLERNPEYFVSHEGSPPGMRQAEEEFESELPPGWTFSRKWSIGILGLSGAVEAFMTIVSDMLAPDVWHIGLFILATDKHGQGTATRIYERIESWLIASGAKWLRLGVIVGNSRAERFWQRSGFSEVRRRHGVKIGEKIHSVRVMVKPLTSASLHDYLAAVPRDRPDSD
jgi:GNAT superfamily N-acetyltransferase